MAKITRIKASDGPREGDEPKKSGKKTVTRVKSGGEDSTKSRKVVKKSGKKPFILFRPFIALGHYLRDSWHELRQVRWPNRKMTWQMLIAVLVYSLLFVVLISILDLAFRGLFNLILNR